MNAVVETINTAGRAFVDFALPMLIQSSLLILILLVVDAVLRRKVRAVFRYWIWMLVLIKLVLPPSLWSPVSLGTWFGATLEAPTAALLETEESPFTQAPATELVSTAVSILSQPHFVRPEPLVPATMETMSQTPASTDVQRRNVPEQAGLVPAEMSEATAAIPSTSATLSWQGLTLLIWAAVVGALLLLLVQRAFFVRGLVAQADGAGRALLEVLQECRVRAGVRGQMSLRLSPNAMSPAVCGLIRPVILVPQNLAPRLHERDLRAVLLHELAHVKRGDLWVNLVQTLLQIVYFYHPLLWLANAAMRRAREQAVDETVLVALGETAAQYPETLVNVAKLAFKRRPALSLRLIGVVESKSALTARIRHILTRPLPRTAKLGALSLVVIAVTALVLLPMAGAAEQHASTVSAGPLDIRLIGVSPDGSDELYGADGKKLDITLAPLGLWDGPWEADQRRRDFVFEVPRFDGQLLFLPFPPLCPAGTNYRLGGFVNVLGPDDSPSTVVVSGTFARTYRRSWARIFTHEVPVRKVDLTLQYFHGPRREALCTFTGPFRMGQVVQADEGRPCQLTPQPFDTGRESWIKFHFTTNESFEHNMPVLLYDKQGRRHLLRGSGGGSISPRGADLTYEDDSIPWDQIAAITIGEKPHEIAFRNIKVHYPGRPQRTYPESLDAMAQRLNLTGLGPEKLGGYRFRNLDEAFAVLDIARGRSQIGKIVKTCKRSRPPVDFTALRPDIRNTIHRTATSWAQSPSVWVRARGVELGLMAGFGEFIDPAFALLDYHHPEDLRTTHDVQYQVLSGLGRYPNGLPAAEMDRLIQFALQCTDGYTWGCLFRECLRNPRHAGLTNVLWGLARDDRPWVWWPAVAQLLLRNDKRLKAYADLPERMKLRLILVDFRQLPGEESLRPKARAMLPGLLTAETVRMCPEIASDLRRAITADLDHKEATAVYMSLLREVSRPGTVWRFREDHGEQHLLYSFVPALVRDVNLWYGVNIGHLGLFEPGKVNERLPGPDTLVRVAAEAVDWYQAHAEQPPRELPFEGRVVDSGGKPIAGATVTLHQEIIVATGLGEGTVHEGGVTTTQTDSEGHFVFQNPPPAKSDRLRLAVAAAGFADHVNIQVDQLQDGRFYFGADPANNVIVLEKPAVLRGRAIGRDGKPLALTELTLYLYPTHGVPNTQLMRTDAQGHFVYGSIMSGIHLLRYGESIRHGVQDNYPGLTAAKLIRIEEGQIVDDVVLDLRESTACLDIEIVNSAGQPIGADRISLEILATSRKPPHPWVLSLDDVKPQGVHRVPNLPPLEGYLSVLAAGQPFKAVPVKLVANETTHYKVVFAEDASRHWNLATDMTGAPVDGAAPDRPAPLGASQGLASVDTDGDGLSDFQEVHKYLTDPAKTDSDGDGTPDGDWDERREYAYSVRTVLRYMPPFDEDGLNDDFQDGRVLNRTGEYIEVEVIHYPLATSHESVPENPNWKQDYAHMTEYLAPGVTTNWDEQMRRDLLAALKADGIDVESLTDKQVVEQVSRWLLHRSRSLDKVFTTYYVDFPEGRPRVYPGLEEVFRREFERDSDNYDWTIEQHFDHELLGKGMFYNETHGSCTSTAVYLTTVLRALGIPTRMVLATPPVDASDRAQILMVKNAITHHRVRETILAGLRRSRGGWTNHTFNEVYVGHRWCRLDYNQLGCPILGVNRFGLQTHLYTLNDLSDVSFAPTWGRRYARGWRNEFFEHDNPYSAVEVSDLFGVHANLPNPPFTAQDLHLPSNPRPNIFLFYPEQADVWSAVMEVVKDNVWDRTGRAHTKEFYENLFEGVWTTKPGDILVLLFSLDTSERIPAGYEDLLPQPWFEIESQLQQSRTVELSGKARAKNVILLAAPTAQELKPLVQNSKLLQTIGGAGPVPSAASTPPAALAPPATKPAKLPNGVTIELLGVSEYPSEGKPWWRPDGSTLDAAPYKTTNNKRELKEGFRDYELVVRYGGAPDMDIEWDAPGSASTGVTGSPYDADGEPIRDLTVCTVRFPEDRTTTEVRVAAAAGAWETRATHNSPEREGTYALDDGRAVAFGIAHFREGRTLVPVTTNFLREDIDFRVVAVRDQDQACTGGLSGFGDGNLRSLTYLFNCPLSDIKEFRVQTRPWAWTTFNNVSLRPGHQTDFAVKLPDAKTTTAPSGRVSGAGKIVAIGPAWEVLRDELGPCYRGSIGGFSTDERRCVEYFEKVLSWAGPGDTFVLMFAFDRAAVVPAQYQDLLPLPWSEIESRVGKGEQVEARGTARDLNVVLLAAPTFEQLNTLVRQTHLLDAFRTNISVDENTAASDQGAGGGAPAGRQTSPDADAASLTPVVAELPDGDIGTEETLPEQVQFGPSVERVLGRDATYIDLEQGMTPSPPSNLLPGDKTQALLQWCRSNGIDAIADPATGSLNCLDAQVVELNPDAWTSLSVGGLRQAVECGPRITSPPVDGLPVVSLQDAGRPATYGLRTRTGTLGLLQIVDAANPQDGGLAFVKIRYRLALAAIAENTAPEQRELWLGLRQYLDLDTGRFVDVAPGEATDPKTLMSRGVDLYLTVEPFTANGPSVAQIQSLQLEFARAPARLYLQEIAADQVREALQMAVRQLDKPKRVTAHVAEGAYAFRTVEGTAGVFRVIWARNMDVPRCTLQYRLIPELDIPRAAFPWGAPAEGRQCRLRASQRAWRAGETVTLSLDVRNQGKEALRFLPVAAAQCELEVDGAWYGWAEPLMMGTPVRVLEPGTELNDALDIRLTDSWALPADGVPLTFAPGMAPQWGRRLVLTPGRHAVRVRFYASENRLSPATQDLSVISNPVEIAILSPDGSASEGTQVGPGATTSGSADDGKKEPFSVYGTVTDPSGRPMAGVEVTAHCGFATLMPTGRTVTDEAGRYTLQFKPGILGRDVMLQAATICARKVGFYEASLCRQGNLAMAGRMPSGPEQQRISHYVGVVLPNQPRELNFVMRPAARIEGELVDARGKPLPGRTLVLTGDELYPSTNALTSLETDQDGAFVIESVPLESFWFEYGHRPPVKSASIPFSIPGTWPIKLSYDESARGTPRLTIANLQQPTSVLGLLDPSVRTNGNLPVAELANGVAVMLLGLFTGPDMEHLQWWYPDGTPAPAKRFERYLKSYVMVIPRNRMFEYGYVLAFNPVEGMSVQTMVDAGTERTWFWTPDSSIGIGYVTSSEARHKAGLSGVGDIRVAVATGSYKPIGRRFDYGKVDDSLLLDEGYRLTLFTPHAQEPALISTVVNTDGLDIRVHSRLANNETRIDGPGSVQRCQPGPLTSYDFYLTADKSYFIDSISLDYRPADVVHFRNVALCPDQQTEVRVEVRPVRTAATKSPTTTGPGPLGRHALSFDGVDDRLIVPARPSLALKSPFTVEIWFKPDPNVEPSSPMALMQKGRKPADPKKVQAGGFLLLGGRPAKDDVPGSGSLFGAGADGGPSQVTMSRSPSLERPGWAHICARYTREDYVPVADEPLLIGDDFVPDSLPALPFKGEIAEIRIWSKALTDAEVQWYRSTSLTGNEPNLVACWTFDEGSGQTVRDISRNGNHAHLGSVTAADGADPKWVALSGDSRSQTSEAENVSDQNAGQSLTTTSATEYVRRYLEDWKTTARNNYFLEDYEILDEYVLEGSAGAVAFVWVRNTLSAAGGVDRRPHEGVIFLYRLNTDRWEGVFNFDGALGQDKNRDRVDRLLAMYRQEWCPQYLARIEQGYISTGGRRRPDRPVDRIPVQAAEGDANRQVDVRLADERGPVGTQTEVVSRSQPSERTEDALKHLIDEAQPGGTVTVPKGRYTTPVEITKPVVLRGESQESCIIEVTADRPAVLVNTGGKGEVTLENLTIQWQLATSERVEQPFALAVKDTNALIRNCRFVPLGDYRRSPVAVRIDGLSKTTVDNCRFNGFEYVICYGEGTEGTVQDCVITDCGHQGVINYTRATLTVQRCLITGSKFHAVRCTGGTLHVKDNLLIKNANRGIYLGNKTGRGTITNNLILGNGAGISGFGRAEYAIANNVIVDNKYTAINMRDSCRLSIRDNVLAGNQGGIALYKEGTENYNVIAGNTYWSNATDFENLEKPAGSLTADPQFADPNHGDFSVRGPAKEAGHGLTNPQIIRELWKKCEQLQRERPAEPATRADSVPSPAQVQVSTPAPSQTQPPTVPAWQRADLYVPPDPNGFFPDDPEGGRKLDALFQAVDKDKRSDEEILSTVRQGLRRTTQHRTLVLAWIGNRYIWGKEPQNPQAIEIMYHAVPLERHYAIYFGLSVVKNKSPNLLRTLADICMQGEEVGRITWGIGPQRDEILSYITPYLQDGDAGKREIAGLLVKHFRGELDFEKWQRERRLEQIKVEFQDQLPQLRETLLTGDSQARREALRTIQRNGLGSILDDSFLAALEAAATDRDWEVRNDVARLVGGRWVWNAPGQDPNAIDLMLRLSRDGNREVHYNAVYFGLSTVRDKGEPVVRRLVEMALAEHENNLYGRIVWGLKGPMKAAPEPFVKILAEHLGRTKSDVHYAASVYLLYRDVLEQEPPGEWGLARIKERYPEDLFAVPFSAREPFVPKDADALWTAFIEKLPEGVAARRLPEWVGRGSVVCSAGVRGREQADMIKESIESNPRLRLGESYPLSLSVQLFLEERYGPVGSGPVGGLPESQPQAEGPAPAETIAAAAAPGPIQQRIDAAAPGATIRLEPGVYKERLVINKPLTLEGAGWDKTVVMTEKENFGSVEETYRLMMQRVAQARSNAEREQITAQVQKEFAEKMSPVMLSVERAEGVVVRGIKFSSPGGRIKGTSVSLPIVRFDQSRARMSDCAVLAGPGNGIHVQDGSDVEIDRTLVAAVWGTGVGVTSGTIPARAHIHDSDIRNCHYAGIRVAGRSTEAVIERCRISGAAWHGVRYDNVSPTLRNNLIFGNARSGIYASGQTAATVKGNLLYDNEMTGMSCWFQNQDVIEGNTFAANERSGLEVLGASKPVVVKNIFYDNPTAVYLGDISGNSPFAQSDGQIALEDNLFWANEHNLQWSRSADAKRTIPLDEKAGAVADPQFADPSAGEFSLPADSPARQKGIGAAGLIPFESPWPLQPEELAIIPKGDTRDSRQWREPS